MGYILRKSIEFIFNRLRTLNPKERGRPRSTWKRTLIDEAKAAEKEFREVQTLLHIIELNDRGHFFVEPKRDKMKE